MAILGNNTARAERFFRLARIASECLRMNQFLNESLVYDTLLLIVQFVKLSLVSGALLFGL